MPLFPSLINLRQRLANAINPNKVIYNRYNAAMYDTVGAGYTTYDPAMPTYIDQGFSSNPDVYAMIKQMADKTSSVPYMVKDVEDENAKSKRDRLLKATNNNLSIQQKLSLLTLEKKAFSDVERPFPLDRPNPLQTWEEVWSLYKIFIRITGNCYFYLLAPEDGVNAGVPLQLYVLPAQFINIELWNDADLLGVESPIKGYTLITGKQYTFFPEKDVIHIKYSNPNYDTNGRHLYGFSPTRAGLKNLQTSNTALALNLKTLQSGGAYGIISGKSPAVLGADQAGAIKQRLVEMQADPTLLAKFAAVSEEIAFTRLSLTTEELMPFSFLDFDLKTLANIFGWDVRLMNDDKALTMDNFKQARKRIITDNIQPDLNLLSHALNDEFLPRFPGYENSVVEFDITELPEMQEEIGEMTTWLNGALDRGVIHRDEYREVIKFAPINNPVMETMTVGMNVISLEEAITPEEFNIVEDDPQDTENMEETE